MPLSLASQIVSASAARTQASLGLAVLKQQHAADMNAANLVAQAAQAPVPQGQGLRVDKLA